MNLKPCGLLLAVLALASTLYGCVTADERSVTPKISGPTDETGESQFCKWKFRRNQKPHHVAIKGTLQVEEKAGIGSNTCAADESDTLCLGKVPGGPCYAVRRINDDSGFDFTLTGSPCRWCYLNSAGGMSCVVYSGGC